MHNRIAALESKSAPRATLWHRVIVDGQSKADALAAYEARRGAIGSGGVIYRAIVDPIRAGGPVR